MAWIAIVILVWLAFAWIVVDTYKDWATEGDDAPMPVRVLGWTGGIWFLVWPAALTVGLVGDDASDTRVIDMLVGGAIYGSYWLAYRMGKLEGSHKASSR